MGRQSRRRRANREAPRWEPPKLAEQSPWRRVQMGALLGGAAALIALAAGAVRVVIALLGGVRIRFDELQVILFYVGGFILAGAVMGLLAPLHRTRAGRFTLGTVGAGIAIFVMVRGIRGSLAGWRGADWASVLILTVIFGVVLTRQIDP